MSENRLKVLNEKTSANMRTKKTTFGKIEKNYNFKSFYDIHPKKKNFTY